MIQRSKLDLNFFSPAFSTPCLSSGPVNRSDAWHIEVALPAQKGCAQTISVNVLKLFHLKVQLIQDHNFGSLFVSEWIQIAFKSFSLQCCNFYLEIVPWVNASVNSSCVPPFYALMLHFTYFMLHEIFYLDVVFFYLDEIFHLNNIFLQWI